MGDTTGQHFCNCFCLENCHLRLLSLNFPHPVYFWVSFSNIYVRYPAFFIWLSNLPGFTSVEQNWNNIGLEYLDVEFPCRLTINFYHFGCSLYHYSSHNFCCYRHQDDSSPVTTLNWISFLCSLIISPFLQSSSTILASQIVLRSSGNTSTDQQLFLYQL